MRCAFPPYETGVAVAQQEEDIARLRTRLEHADNKPLREMM
jgi:hypothetical protein